MSHDRKSPRERGSQTNPELKPRADSRRAIQTTPRPVNVRFFRDRGISITATACQTTGSLRQCRPSVTGLCKASYNPDGTSICF